MKKITQSLIALLVLGFVASAYAQFVSDPATLSARAATFRDTDVQEDQSKLPSQENRGGYLYYVYDVARDGGSGTVQIGPDLGDNVIAHAGFAQVITAVLPATATNSLGINTAVDVLAAGTTLQATGIDPLAAVVSVPVLTDAATDALSVTWTGATATQGVFAIYLELIKGQ